MPSDHDAGSARSEDTKKAKSNDVMQRLGKNQNCSNPSDEEVFKLAPFNPSSDQIQKMALDMLQLGPSDVLFDLGCGDGRFLCYAANQIPGLKCVGLEIDAEFVSRGRDKVAKSQLQDRVDVRLEDATKAGDENTSNGTDQSTTPEKIVQQLTLMKDATALYLFILPKGIVKMMPILNALKQKRLAEGKRFKVLSYMFKIREWEPTIVDETAKGSCPVYYYDIGGPE